VVQGTHLSVSARKKLCCTSSYVGLDEYTSFTPEKPPLTRQYLSMAWRRRGEREGGKGRGEESGGDEERPSLSRFDLFVVVCSSSVVRNDNNCSLTLRAIDTRLSPAPAVLLHLRLARSDRYHGDHAVASRVEGERLKDSPGR